ncbi:MAG: DUF4954 family protein, partial [Planctomycetes bacterium]|nr:DUF4954 family protein [Planctomycetota bacterium]
MDDSASRPLTKQEIARLTAQGCVADDWARVRVAPGFGPGRLWCAQLRGDCRLGALTRPESVIRDAELSQCEVGDDVHIARAAAHDCAIGDGAVIDNVGAIEGRPTGDATPPPEAAVVCESGGREVALHPGLSAPLAWLETFADSTPGGQAL